MDLSEGFRSFVKGFFKKAEIVADKFHVIRLFTKALNRRRLDVSGVDKKTPLRSLLLRNAEDLEEHETKVLRFWLGGHPDVRELYELKEAIRRLYRIKGYKRANRALTKLTDRMDSSSLEAVKTLRETLLNWRREVMAYFKTGLTNAMSEGFNNKLKLVQRRAFGLRSFAHYRLRALNACA
jgi:transposase